MRSRQTLLWTACTLVCWQHWREAVRSSRTLCLVLLMMILCWTPYTIVILIDFGDTLSMKVCPCARVPLIALRILRFFIEVRPDQFSTKMSHVYVYEYERTRVGESSEFSADAVFYSLDSCVCRSLLTGPLHLFLVFMTMMMCTSSCVSSFRAPGALVGHLLRSPSLLSDDFHLRIYEPGV